MTTDSDISILFTRLSSVESFTVKASSVDEWQACGAGLVNVQKSNEDNVIWRESGSWDKNLNNLEFSNVYRWTEIDQKHLLLEHLRYGEENPVQLVELKCNQQNKWNSIKPHLCALDEYRLDLEILKDKLIITWQIYGPKKDQVSTIYYR